MAHRLGIRTLGAILVAVGARAQHTPTGRVAGRVVDMLGNPIAAAPVQVTEWHAPDRVLAAGITDATGWFSLPDVPFAAMWGIGVLAKGCTPTRVWSRPGRAAVTIRVPESVRITGTLRDGAGRAAAGVTVAASLAFARELQGARELAVTDAEGRFELRHAPMGFLCLMAVLPRDGLTMRTRYVPAAAELDLGPPEWTTRTVSFRIDGLPETGPPPGTRIELAPLDVACRELPPAWQSIVPDAAGHSTVAGLPPWRLLVRPSIPGFACEPASANLAIDDDSVRFTATRAEVREQTWSGTLVDDRGAPLPGQTLTLRDPGHGERVDTTTDERGGWRFAVPVPRGTVVDIQIAAGEFVLDQPGEGSAIDPSGRARYRGSEPGRPLTLQAVRAASVRGSAKLADGAAAAFARVRLEQSHPDRMPTWWPVAEVVTDAEGRYDVRGVLALDRPMRIAITSQDGTAVSDAFALDRPGAHVDVPALVLAPLGVVDGDVRDADGKVLPGVRVWLREWDVATNRQRSGSVVELLTDKHGRFRFTGVPAGGAMLQVAVTEEMPREFASAPFEVVPGRSHTFALTHDAP